MTGRRCSERARQHLAWNVTTYIVLAFVITSCLALAVTAVVVR